MVQGYFDFYTCTGCDSVSLIPLPDEAEVATFYPASYMVKRPSSNGSRVSQLCLMEWQTIFLPVYRSGARSVLRMTGTDTGRLLEVGCSSGYQLLEFARAGDLEVLGLDIDALAVDHARRKLGLNVVNQTLQEAKLPAESFDLVILFNVLEYLVKPLGTFREVNRILKPGGHLAIKTQIIDSIQSRLFGGRWMMLHEAPRHALLASTAGIERALNNAGMRLVDQTSGPILENGFSIALSILPNATSALALGRNRSLSGLLYRAAGMVLGIFSIPFVLLERALGLSGTMIFIAAKVSGRSTPATS